MIVPYLFTFIQSVLLSTFRVKHSPPFLLTIWVNSNGKENSILLFSSQVHFVEACHTLGLSLLVFRILPSIDNITGLFILNGVYIVPGILNLFASHHGQNQILRLLSLLTDIAAVLMQLSICFIPYILPTTTKIPAELQWQLPLALLLISFGYWESFAELNFSRKSFFKWFRHSVRSLQKTRPKVYITASLLKIIVLIASAVYFLPNFIDKNLYSHIFHQIPIGEKFARQLNAYDPEDDLFRITRSVYIPCLIQIFSSCICYYTGRIACKVRRRFFEKISMEEWGYLGFNAMRWIFITINYVNTCYVYYFILYARIDQTKHFYWRFLSFG